MPPPADRPAVQLHEVRRRAEALHVGVPGEQHERAPGRDAAQLLGGVLRQRGRVHHHHVHPPEQRPQPVAELLLLLGRRPRLAEPSGSARAPGARTGRSSRPRAARAPSRPPARGSRPRAGGRARSARCRRRAPSGARARPSRGCRRRTRTGGRSARSARTSVNSNGEPLEVRSPAKNSGLLPTARSSAGSASRLLCRSEASTRWRRSRPRLAVASWPPPAAQGPRAARSAPPRSRARSPAPARSSAARPGCRARWRSTRDLRSRRAAAAAARAPGTARASFRSPSANSQRSRGAPCPRTASATTSPAASANRNTTSRSTRR